MVMPPVSFGTSASPVDSAVGTAPADGQSSAATTTDVAPMSQDGFDASNVHQAGFGKCVVALGFLAALCNANPNMTGSPNTRTILTPPPVQLPREDKVGAGSP